jgi:creatinine amidohydrolase
MFPDELEKAFVACPVVYFSYGLCEPHGTQNVLGLDALKAHGIACEAARKHGGIVAPPDFWHIHEIVGYALWGNKAIGEVERKWLTAVPPSVHFKNVCYHIRTADVLGFHAAILLTGHYGPNWKDLNGDFGYFSKWLSKPCYHWVQNCELTFVLFLDPDIVRVHFENFVQKYTFLRIYPKFSKF